MARPRTVASEIDAARLALAVRAVMSCGDPGPDGRRVPLSQSQVAAEAGVTDPDVSALLGQGSLRSLNAAVKLMAWLRLSPDQFMRDPAPAAAPDPVAAA